MRWERLQSAQLAEALKTANGSLHLVTSFLAMLPLPAFVHDKRGRLLYLNPHAETFWKLRRPNVIGKTLAELFDSESSGKELRESMERILRTNGAHVYFHVERDPHRYTVLKFPFSDSDGHRVFGAIVVEHVERHAENE